MTDMTIFQARVLESLAEPATQLQLAQRLCVNRYCAALAIKELVRQKRAFLSDWILPVGSGHASAVYTQGQGVSPPRPRASHDARILAILPATAREISEKLGMSQSTACTAITRMRGRVFVSGWKNLERGVKAAIYDATSCPVPDASAPLEIQYVARPRTDCVLRGTPWAGMSFIGAQA